jgi:hypothetical protein
VRSPGEHLLKPGSGPIRRPRPFAAVQPHWWGYFEGNDALEGIRTFGGGGTSARPPRADAALGAR